MTVTTVSKAASSSGTAEWLAPHSGTGPPHVGVAVGVGVGVGVEAVFTPPHGM